MKELSIEEKAKRYDEAIEKAKSLYKAAEPMSGCKVLMEAIFPELKESEDERIRKEIINFLYHPNIIVKKERRNDWLAWLEKQGDTNKTINKDKFVQGVLRGAAINLINWIDYNAAEGNMCLSNMECKDIEDALVSGDWKNPYLIINFNSKTIEIYNNYRE